MERTRKADIEQPWRALRGALGAARWHFDQSGKRRWVRRGSSVGDPDHARYRTPSPEDRIDALLTAERQLARAARQLHEARFQLRQYVEQTQRDRREQLEAINRG